jgi:hypothetical protein
MRPPTVAAAQAVLDARARTLGDAVGADGPALLRERAELLGVEPQGTISAGGTCRLLPARDGRWVAMNLARRSDTDLLAAWMGADWDGPVWDAVERALAGMTADHAADRAQLLGIPAAVAVAAPPTPDQATPDQLPPDQPQADQMASRLDGTRVLDLSAMWAGPLCARLLGDLGATVTKVELRGRPDGARAGPPAFWRALNGAKRERIVDTAAELGALVDDADVVITSARARALEQLGLDLAHHVYERALVWVAITGYGIGGAWRDRVAFGDDAAVAGGLAVAAGGLDAPVFVGDAPADPLAGLAAAGRARRAVAAARGSIIDVALRDVVAGAIASQYDSVIDRAISQEVA